MGRDVSDRSVMSTCITAVHAVHSVYSSMQVGVVWEGLGKAQLKFFSLPGSCQQVHLSCNARGHSLYCV